MSKVKIAIDAMGGDHAPAIVVEGSVKAVKENPDIELVLFGDESAIQSELKKYDGVKNIQVIHTTETISNHESPVLALRRKKDSSLVKALNYVKEDKADAFISAGSTGAILAGGTLIIGRIKGIERPALGSIIPTMNGQTLLIDCGANVDSKAEYLLQFAKMGRYYYEAFLDEENPSVGLLNVGEEETKGNQLAKEAYHLLSNEANINFMGNIEGRDISEGKARVIVTDGFAGNLILKHTEGLASMIMKMLKETMTSTWYAKIGALLLKGPLKKRLASFDYTEYGGAPLLGLEKLVVKAHGSSNAKAFKNAILQCKKFNDRKVNQKIKQSLL